jgi:hypothetical protein
MAEHNRNHRRSDQFRCSFSTHNSICDAYDLIIFLRAAHDDDNHKTAVFRQINKQRLVAHHDALEFPDGQVMLLTLLCEGQQATVLQLPRRPKTTEDAANLGRAAYAG